MFRYRLSTLLVLLILAPPIIAGWMVVNRDPFQIFLAIGFIAYLLLVVAIAHVVAYAVDALKKLL